MTANNQVAEADVKYFADAVGQDVSAGYLCPTGYKQTEVGVIPKDWTVFNLPEIIWYQEGPGLRKWQFKLKGLKVINVTNLQDNGYLDLDKTDRHISWDECEKTYKHFLCDVGDLVIASSGNSYCKASIVHACDLPLLMNTSVIRFKPQGDFSKKYMEVYLKSPYFKNQIDLLITGGAQPNFGPAHLKQIKIPAPILAGEQTAIANALSDVDALINELEKLIAKKQAIKTATMQQLLTGRTRLPQFALREDGTLKGYKQSELGEIPEDWDVVPFSNMLTIRHGRSQKNVESTNGKYPIFATGGQIGTASAFLYDKPSVLIGRKGTIDKPRYADTPFWTVDTLFYSEIKQNANARFIFYKFCMVDWMQYNEASGVPSLNASTIESVLTCIPSKEEQTAIATILSDMDEEIQTLQKRLAKTRQIKQGMMQELLTGKTRLIQLSPKDNCHA